MSAVETPTLPLPTGYTIVERLGAGGYGEVWKATAPGGVEKAVKLVYGHCSEGMAERELKALERVKSVRHPFILTIERYEIVESRLVIVTELADMSLQDEFQSCQANGQVGISQPRLLSYLWDAAEALDYLAERHELQHLDIKPENLLVVGDHTKVADFGLVKQLATQTLNSMMGGITPLYSAPEIFDDNPSSRSDQYSLAIVYQYLLTGTMPFPGRTPAQLAKQHTLAKPNLRPLSEQDRQVVDKALQKDPADRFSNCREFVTALKSGDAPGVSPKSGNPESTFVTPTPSTITDTTPVAELDTEAIEATTFNTATQILSNDELGESPTPECAEPPQEVAPPLSYPTVDPRIVDVEVPDVHLEKLSSATPTLFIGVGGIGVRMLRALWTRSGETDLASETPLAWLAIDTDRDSLKPDRGLGEKGELSLEDFLHIPLRRPKQYRDNSQNLLRWVSRRWLYNIPRSLQTRGFRPLGRIAAVDHAEEILSAIHSRITKLAQQHERPENNAHLRVVLLAGTSGGTGSGTLIDVAQAVRALCKTASLSVTVHGLLANTYELGSGDTLAASNLLSFLTEFSHAQTNGNCGDGTPEGAASLFESQDRPFDDVSITSLPQNGSSDCAAKLQSIADYLLLNSDLRTSSLNEVLLAESADSADLNSLRPFECVNLSNLADEVNRNQQQELLATIASHWLREVDANGDSSAQFFGQYANCWIVRAVLDHYPKISASTTVEEDEQDNKKAHHKRNADLKQVSAALSEFLFQRSPGESSELEAPIEELSHLVIAEFVDTIRRGAVQPLELGQKLLETLEKHLAESFGRVLSESPNDLVRSVLRKAKTDLLECGYLRHSALLTSDEHDPGELLENLREEQKSVAACQTSLSEQFFVRLGIGLRPLDIGAKLAETFPDISEAAGRLHTRSDINWHDLRSQQDEAEGS